MLLVRCLRIKQQYSFHPIRILKNELRHYVTHTHTHDGYSYFYQPGKNPLLYMNFGQLIDRASELFSDQIFIQSEHQKIKYTFREISKKTDKLAAGLLALGLQPGDRIGLFGTNSMEWVLSALAAAKAGVISVNINPSSQIPELKHCLKTAQVKAIMFDELSNFQNPIEMINTIKKEFVNSDATKNMLSTLIVFSEKKYPGMLTLADVINTANDTTMSQVNFLKTAIQSDDGCNIQFTSGTTGAPKAALLTHHGMINNAISIGRRLNLNNQTDSISLSVPLFHCYGFVIGLAVALYDGIRIVLPSPTFSSLKTIEAIQKENLTMIYGTPTMFIDILDKLKNSRQKLNTLKYAITAGSLCSPQLFEQIKNDFQLRSIKTCYGMTETSPVSFCTTNDQNWADNTETVGRIMEHVEAKVVDKEGRLVPFGTPGELLVRGYMNMLGYWRNELATKDMIGPDRWLKTGDQFVLRKDGVGKLAGRIKDIIIRGGENIFPKEIEEFLEGHPDILEAQVYGVPDRRLGEIICASIRMKNKKNLNVEDIKNYSKGKISHFKIPQHLTIVDQFPKTLSGKIKKYELKKEMEERLSKNPSS